MRHDRAALVAVLIIALAACGGRRDVEPPPADAGVPVDRYRDALERGDAVYRVDPEQSLVTIYAYRDGPLARLGHDHVVAGRQLEGLAAVPASGGTARADVSMPLATLDVDDPALRAEAGFDSEPTEADIAGTRDNMLTSLDVGLYPSVLVSVTLAAPPPDASLKVRVQLHGMTREFDLPVDLSIDDDRVAVSGAFDLLQTDFGIDPHSVFGGALSVDDRLAVSFRLRAARVTCCL